MQESGKATTARSLARFLESFFRERNIKWMLLTGVLILIGSSLMLVTKHWGEIAPAWKSLAILGYTAAAFAGGRLAYFRLGLRTTGTVLLALSVLLIPIDFLALHWVESPVAVVLFLANLAFAWPAAKSVFDHFLHARQPTFLASYITLAAAGAAARLVPEGLMPWAALALWGAFTAGAVKVNRHVFWLAEERKLPRIFGFFPIALLGAQFLALYLLHFRERIEPQWVGLGYALVAVPVLLTADAIARVFESRTGGILRPLPTSVILPLGSGILLATAGLCLASVNLFSPERDALALVPTAAIVAALMGLVARRTSRSAFVWAMLAALTIAYNFSPVFFRDLAGSVVSWGAAAVREERLPYAFYGLTYLPLLVAAGLTADRLARRGDSLFQRPIQAYSIGLACLFLAGSATHEMTLLPVAGAIAGFLAWRAWRFRETASAHVALVLLAILAYTAALAGVGTFVERAMGLQFPRGATLLVEAIGILPLLVHRRRLYRIAGAVIALVLAAFWIATFVSGPGGSIAWLSAGAISAVLAVCALERVMPLAGEATILFPFVAFLLRRAHDGASGLELLQLGTLLACGVWVLAAFLKDGRSLLARAFEGPSLRVSAALLAVSIGLHLPLLARETAGAGALESIGQSPLGLAASVALALWAFDAARRFAMPELFYYPAALCALGAAGVAARAYGASGDLDGVALVWAAGGLAVLAAIHRSTLAHARLLVSGAEPREVALSAERLRHAARILGALFLGVSALSLTSLAWPMRVAGGMAVAGLLGVFALRAPALRRLAWIPASWQLILFVVRLSTPEIETTAGFLAAALPAALASSACLMAFHAFHAAEAAPGGPLLSAQRVLLRALAIAALAASVVKSSLGSLEGVAAAASFGLLVASEVLSASRLGDARRAWTAQAILAAAVLYFIRFGWISFGHGVSTYVLVGSGFLLHGLGRLAARRPVTVVLAEPFLKTAAWLPLVAVVAAVWKALLDAPVPWMGSRSLALLLAAGFYFWRGMEGNRKGLVVLAGAIANIALAILWRELRWTDPQFFLVPLGASVLALVELLREEIPRAWRDPLRYAGALVILVSPVFHIVEGSWLHMLTLMLATVGIILVAIGLRVRAMLYMGTAFLAADLVAMVVRGSIENLNVLWIAGLSLGALIIGLAAVCENRRETLLAKARLAAAVLEEWD